MFRKTLPSYSAQARYLHSSLRTDDSGDWTVAGWTKLQNGAVKPVFTHLGRPTFPVVLLDGKSHTAVVVVEIAPADVRATEEECY